MKKYSMLILITLLVLVGCKSEIEPAGKEEELKPFEKPPLSIWLPEWQTKTVLADLEKTATGLDRLHIFGAYFNEQDEPFLTESAEDLYTKVDEKYGESHTIILTFINDLVIPEQPSLQKDSELLHRLLKNEQSRKKHIEDLLEVVEQYPVNGIEIDYEKIVVEDIEHYSLFLEELYEALSAIDLQLHVVLEPNFPFSTALPDGPTYTVMAYNLHGYHNEAGPKANYQFIDEILDKIAQSNQKFQFAFATGGFAWPEKGQPIAVTGYELEEIKEKHNIITKRDKNSDAVHFYYKNEENSEHYEGWYADTFALSSWMNYVRKKQVAENHFILWRAGGLTKGTMDWITE